jgi:hypothetical protein
MSNRGWWFSIAADDKPKATFSVLNIFSLQAATVKANRRS